MPARTAPAITTNNAIHDQATIHRGFDVAFCIDLPNKEQRVTAVHGHHGEPCLRCGTRLERVSFAEYELVYCPACQTGGRIYRDRRMSRLLGEKP